MHCISISLKLKAQIISIQASYEDQHDDERFLNFGFEESNVLKVYKYS